ncbi:Protein CBG06226 [Caenorhabditis briggsae]|uniref:Cleavage and polyadenylation specificity factor subunit 4 n=1 Tax=Caenorhabditis briggsae TaxID=6238 RepID=A8X0L5_CAEBR|nr:Protein CBG06226 [Caenorhabditis briggsae]CAP26175.1 Protein CBG06226 [Caenorhabditis briggsae]
MQLKAMDKAFVPQTMADLVSNITARSTDVEDALFNQKGMKEAPFRDLDRSGKAVCTKNKTKQCPFGNTCPLRHIDGEKAVVCKHWLRGLCKKGDQCEFLHEYDLTKMPECFFFSKYSACSNRECPFRHIDPETKLKDCPWYDRGFCRHGPYCKHRHRRRAVCPNYLAGFCPQGPDCQYAHPSFGLPNLENIPISHSKPVYSQGITCHNCHERGHKATSCPSLPGQNRQSQDHHHRVDLSMIPDKKNLSDVTCYKMPRKRGAPAETGNRSRVTRRSNTHTAPPSKRKPSPDSEVDSDDDYEASTSTARKGKRGGSTAIRGRGGSKSKRASHQMKEDVDEDFDDDDEEEEEDNGANEASEETPEVTPKKQPKSTAKNKKKKETPPTSPSPTPSLSPSPAPVVVKPEPAPRRGRKSVAPTGRGKKGPAESETKRSAPSRRKKQVVEDDEEETPEEKKYRERAERKARRIEEAKDRPKMTLEEKLIKLAKKKARRLRRKEQEKEEAMRQKYGSRKIKAEASKWNFGPISSINQRRREEMMVYFPKANFSSTNGVPPGYIVDAITIIDCMHTFCKRCLLNYFDSDNKTCPTCGTFIHGSHPTHYVTYDRALNDLVNQFVPKMEDNELEARKKLLRDCREAIGIDTAAEDRERAERLERERVTGTNRCYPLELPRFSHHRDDCQVTVNLLPGTANLPLITRPFVRCSEMTTMNTLKKFISLQIWDDQSRYGDLDVFCDGQLMGKDFSVRFVWMMKRRGQPKSEPLVIRYHMTRS